MLQLQVSHNGLQSSNSSGVEMVMMLEPFLLLWHEYFAKPCCTWVPVLRSWSWMHAGLIKAHVRCFGPMTLSLMVPWSRSSK